MNKFALGISIGAALKGTFISAVSTGKEKIKGLTGEAARLGKQKIAVDNVKSYRLALSELTATAASSGAANVKLRAKIRETRNALKLAKTEAKGMGINVRKLAAEEKRLEASLKLTNRSLKYRKALDANKQRRSEKHGDLLGAAAPVAAMVVPVKMAVDFESVMADVKKVVDLPTPVAFKAMEKDILALSTQIPMAADGIASIVASAGQAGIAKSREELIGFARTAATMGVAFDISGAESGKMMADWRSGMALSQAQVVGLADAVNHLSNNMNAQARDLGEVLQRQGAVAMSAGLTETQVASLGAALLSGGAGPEIAATALKNLTGAMTKGKAATKAQREAFDALGFDAEEMAARMQENAPAAIKSVFQALKDAPVEEQSALISQLFGEESKGAIAPLLKNLENLGKAFDLTADKAKYAGSMQKEYDVRSKTTANNMALLRNKTQRLGISMGAVLLPAVNTLLTPIGAVMDLAAAGAEKFPTLTTAVVGTAAGAVTLTAATVAGAYAFSFAKDAILKVKLAHTTLKKATIGTTIAQKASAVTTKVTAAAQWLWNKALAAKAFVLAKARTIGIVVAQKATAIAGKVAAGAQWAWNAALGAKAFVFAKARVIALAVAQKATAVATQVLAAAQVGLGAAMKVALGPVGLTITAVTAGAILIYKYWGPIKGFFTRVWSGIKTVVGSGIQFLKTAFMTFHPLGWIIKGFSAIKSFLAGIDWSKPGAAIVSTLVTGIKSVAMKPFEAVKGMFSKVRRLLASSDAKEGPLSDLTHSGRATIVTLETGIRAAEGGLYKRVKDVAGNVAAVTTGMSVDVQRQAAPEGSGLSNRPYGGSPAFSAPSVPSLQGKVAYSAEVLKPVLPDSKAKTLIGALGFDDQAVQKAGLQSLPSGVPSQAGQGQVVLNFNPTINVQGQDGQTVRKNVETALQLSEERLKRMLDRVLSQDRRVSYA